MNSGYLDHVFAVFDRIGYARGTSEGRKRVELFLGFKDFHITVVEIQDAWKRIQRLKNQQFPF